MFLSTLLPFPKKPAAGNWDVRYKRGNSNSSFSPLKCLQGKSKSNCTRSAGWTLDAATQLLYYKGRSFAPLLPFRHKVCLFSQDVLLVRKQGNPCVRLCEEVVLGKVQ